MRDAVRQRDLDRMTVLVAGLGRRFFTIVSRDVAASISRRGTHG